jgi:uncharacterized protein YfaS (alpha-2-macroglobulin family)
MLAIRLRPIAAILSLATAVCAHAATPSATYTGGTLSVSIPYQASHSGTGRLVLELLDPEDHILAASTSSVNAASGNGQWSQSLTPTHPLRLADLIWERLHYRFVYNDEQAPALEETDTIEQILRRPVLHLLGQRTYLAGAPAGLRVILSGDNDSPLPNITRSSIRVELLIPDKTATPLATCRADRRGTCEVQLHFPAGLTGAVQLHVVADTPIGSVETRQSIQIEEAASILLTTEKPIYQPGQTIHVRALALDRAQHHAVANRGLTFELEDARGNKVFKKLTQTDAFGIASAEFTLADEVNLGTYHLRAVMTAHANNDTAATNAQLALNVERYVLPKFKVSIDFATKDGKPQRDFRPGDHVTGTVQASYFFGKPVDGAPITVKASSMDVEVFDAATDKGKTGKDGLYHFDLKLPAYFAGRPLSQGAARVLVEATVTDSADHAETRGEPITVSQASMLLTAVPEGGKLVPGLDNQVYILVSYPDGSPAAAQLTVHVTDASDQHLTTDAGGIAIAHVEAGDGKLTLRLEAADRHGAHAQNTVDLQPRNGTDQVLLRAAHAVYRAGDRIELDILSTKRTGSVYLDILKDGQTILTRDVDLNEGRASLSLTATPAMAGTLDFNAYIFGHDAQPVGDHRLLFVQPADELKIETVADAPEYKPGAEARVRFHVTNARGEGVSAALGLQVVDEAVFALAEKQPGFAKVFFYLEQELMKPRFEIHSLSVDGVKDNLTEPAAGDDLEQRDRAAQVLFSATEAVRTSSFDYVVTRPLPLERQDAFQRRYQTVFEAQAHTVANRLIARLGKAGAGEYLTGIYNEMATQGSAPRDAWGNAMRIDPLRWGQYNEHTYVLRSAGPDGQFDTGDDLVLYLELRPGQQAAHPAARTFGGSIAIQIDHDRGPDNGRAEAEGKVIDTTGAVIPGASILLRTKYNDLLAHANAPSRSATANAHGQFTFAALPPGSYTVEIAKPGFYTASHDLTLAARDHAMLTAKLQVGPVSTAVAVDGAAPVSIVVRKTPPAVQDVRFNRAMGGQVAFPKAAPPPPAPILALRGVAAGAGMAVMDATTTVTSRTVARSTRESVFAANADISATSINEAADPAHVRSYFPEALYINPAILTDGAGNAEIAIPIADSITTWRMAMLASTQAGALGSSTSSLKVFQDFFVDLDLPVTLTQGDRVSLPVALYNYTAQRGDVALTLQPEDWFSLVDDTADKTVAVDPNRVGAAQYTLEARHIGKFKLTLSAHLRGPVDRMDTVVREIEVVPNGKQQDIVYNGRLDTTADHTVAFPQGAIPEASKVFVRLYPGPLSQIVEGMDGILRMPGGCFEQTSSSTYPNVLALDYMKRTRKLTPEVHARAEGYIANGYQRLLTFEVAGGGFSWFGQAPANKILTAYGLMEFHDMAQVYDVDPRLIDRTRNWLITQQQSDGSWKPDTQFINEGATNRFNTDVLRITAYLAWSLEVAGYHGPAIDKARTYIEKHQDEKPDSYTLAVLANFAVDGDKGSALSHHILQQLLDAQQQQGEQVFWDSPQTGMYGAGKSAQVETTGLAVQAILKSGDSPETSRKALAWLTAQKSANGNWGTTQATIMALRALLLASDKGGADAHGTVEVLLNGKTVQSLTLTSENNDLLQQFVLPGIEPAGNRVALRFTGSGGMAYQVAGRYFTPWPPKPAQDALAIDVTYDRTTLARNDVVNAKATIHSHLDKTANMVMVDLGIPPGFDLLSEDLQALVEKTARQHGGKLEKFSLTATQAILYFDGLGPKATVEVPFRLRAKYPIRAKTFASHVYEYYNPAITATAQPIQLEVIDHR